MVIGMNPSHASDANSDDPIDRVIAASIQLGYDGWMMLNLYPERASKPSALNSFDQTLSDANCAAVARAIGGLGATEVLGAWGGIPNATIRAARTAMVGELARLGVRIFHFGTTTLGGQPRHLRPRGPALSLTGPRRYL